MKNRPNRTWASADHLLEEWADVSARARRPSPSALHRQPSTARLATATAAAVVVVVAVAAGALFIRPLGVAGPATPPPTSTSVDTTPTASNPTPAPSFGDPRPASWRLDPGAQIGPDSTSIPVLLSELECASGQSPEGRIVPPVIEYRPDAIVISISVYTDPGDCPSNPEYPLTVDLSEPLGDRVLLGGSGTPATEPPCQVSAVTRYGSWWEEIGGQRAFFNADPTGMYAGPNHTWLIHVRFDPDAAEGQTVALRAVRIGGDERVDARLDGRVVPGNIFRFDQPAPALPGGWYLFEQPLPSGGCWQLSAAIDGEVVGTAVVQVADPPPTTPTPDVPGPTPRISATTRP